MPFATSSQLVFEKTPKYITLDGVAERMKKSLPDSDDLKIIVVVCDPVKRAFSDYTHVIHSNPPVWEDALKHTYNNSFGSYLSKSIEYLESAFNNPTNRPDPTKNFQHFVHQIYKSDRPELSILSNGLYSVLINQWLDVFSRDQFYFVSGEKLITDPSSELMALEEWLGLPKFFKKENFKRSPKGFYCYNRENSQSKEAYCMHGAKGKTRNGITGESIIPEKDQRILKEFYAPFNRIFYRIVNQKFGWE